MKHSKLPWVAARFTKANGEKIETVADVAETIFGSAMKGKRAELFGVTNGIEDESGLEKVICYTGNGPTSDFNAAYIVLCCNSHEALMDALKDARYALYGDGPGNPTIDAAIAAGEGPG